MNPSFIQRAPLAVFNDQDLPSRAGGFLRRHCGFSIYRNVLIQWDEDRDTRILKVIDAFPGHIREHLIIAHEHEGGIDLVWDAPNIFVTPVYSQEHDVEFTRDGFIEVDGDSWGVANHLLKPCPKPLL